LIEKNLIEYLDGTKAFKTTEKGLNYLKMHNEISKLLPQTITVKSDLIFIVTLFLYRFKNKFPIITGNFKIVLLKIDSPFRTAIGIILVDNHFLHR
jgi:hypothetical protein